MKANLSRTGSFAKSKDEHMKRELHSSGFLFRELWQFRTDVSGQSIDSIFKGQESKKESWASHYGVYIVKNVGGGKSSVVHGVDTSG
jgi:hypothetical protein